MSKVVALDNGFSLIELMTVLAIVGILAAIVYPNYLGQVQKTRRSDAKIGLTQLAQQLERCYTESNAYNIPYDANTSLGCPIVTAGPAINTNSPGAHYTITSSVLNATDYTLSATPVSGDAQRKDACYTFTLDNLGNKANLDSTGHTIANNTGCWE